MLYELLPHALRDPEVRARFAEEYRVYRAVDAGLLGAAPRELSEQELEALAAVSIAVVEGLGIQRALDPDGFDHEARLAGLARRRRQLPRAARPLVGAASASASAPASAAGEAAARRSSRRSSAARRRTAGWPPPRRRSRRR